VGVPGRAFECCGDCYECRENDGDVHGYGVWCTNAGNLGLSRDGGFQEWCLVDSRQVAPVPDGMKPVEVAPLMCAGVTVWGALENGGVDMADAQRNKERGLSVGIVGAGGGLGHLGVQFASQLGCEVVAVDRAVGIEGLKGVVERLGGGVQTVDSDKESVEMVKKRCFKNSKLDVPEGEVGCDVVLVLPEAQAAFDYGTALLKNHGTCVIVSFPKKGWRFQPRDVVFRHIKMVGVLVGRNRQLKAMLNFAAESGVRATIKTFALEDLNKLVEVYHKGNFGKLVVDMSKAPEQ
jgi:D-arabinose 1-dehydrogenase-like Zn-dependent alcohol dehydrogenase